MSRKSQKRKSRLESMWKFYREVSAKDCAGLRPLSEKVQYVHEHKSMKLKGGRPPRDYDAVELLVDFKKAMDNDNLDEAIPLYYILKRWLNWSG